MIKLVLPSSWDFGEPTSKLVDFHSRGIDSDWMVKRAAAGVFREFKGLKPDPGHALIHLIAMGDAEYLGLNKNADFFFGSARELDLPHEDWSRIRITPPDGEPYWQEKSAATFGNRTHVGNKERCHTFKTHGHVFKDHKNKAFERKTKDGKIIKADKIYGSVKAAAHNDAMHRVELMIQVPYGPDWDSDLEKMARGEEVEFSMAGLTPADICSVCGHKAKSRDEYCDHLRLHPTALLKSGHVIGAVNDHMTFFDISRVNRRADRIAVGLDLIKAASHDNAVTLSADLGFQLYGHGPSEKPSLLSKAADIEKIMPVKPGIKPQFLNPKLKQEKLAELHKDLPAAYRALAEARVCLDLNDFVLLAGGSEKYAQAQSLIAAATPGLTTLFNEVDPARLNLDAYCPDRETPSNSFRKCASVLAESASIDPQALASRAIQQAITGHQVQIKQAHTVGEEPQFLLNEYASYALAFIDYVSRLEPDLTDHFIESCVAQNQIL